MKTATLLSLACLLVVFGALSVYAQGRYCYLPKKVGDCKAHIPAWYYDHKSGLCTLFFYGGCDGNANRFTTKAACVRSCGCRFPNKVGPCKARIPRWYFRLNRCIKFFWGGCQPNENNFKSKKACERACYYM